MRRKEMARGPLARAVMLGLCVMGMVGCGGGGGGNVRNDPPPAPAAPPPAPPSPSPNSPQPAIDAHLGLTNARSAHGEGITGQGVTIGVIDSGIRRDHPALSGRVTRSLTYLDPRNNDLSVDDKVGHGTWVSQIAGGKAFGKWPGGIAPGASFVSARIISDKPPTDDGSGQGNEVTGADGFDFLHQDLIDAGAKIMNNSWGGLYWNGDNVTASFVNAYKPFVVDWGGLVVFATGNESRPQPSDNASLPSQGAGASILERGWIAAAALDSNNPTQLASYSNACGIAMNYCLVAPGDVVVTGENDTATSPSYWVVKGTSFAAPQVSGAAALVWQKFPYFDNDLVRQTLLGTATDLGAPGVDPVFGRGLLNIQKAMRGPARLDWGDIHARLPNGMHSVWWNDISGAGGIVIDGGGNVVDGVDDSSLSIRGNNTFTGQLRITGGATVAVNGSFQSPIAVDPGSYLYAWEVTLHGDVTNRGVMQINSAKYIEVSTFLKGDIFNHGIFVNRENNNTTIEGNLVQSAQGQFWTILGSAPLHIAGAVQLDGGLHVYNVAPGYVARQKTEVLIADGGVTGQFAWWGADPGLLLQAAIGYGPDRVWLDVNRVNVTAVSGMTYSATSLGSAQRVEGAFVRLDEHGAQIGSEFARAAGELQQSPSLQAVQRSLDSLSGELHSADAAFALMAIEGNRHALESRLDALQDHQAVSGAWSGQPGGKSGWSSFDVDASGWMLGLDQRHGNGVTVGAALSESDGNAWHSQRFDREHNRQVEGQVYASWNVGGGYLLGTAAFGRMQRWLQREIVLGGDEYRVSSDYAHRYGSLGLQGGRRVAVGGSTLTPYLGAQLLQLDRDPFSEQGAAGFGLSSAATSMNATQALLGARFDRRWRAGSALWNLQGRLEWQHLLSQSGQDINARFTGVEAWAPIVGQGLDRDAGVFGLSLGADFGRASRISFDLDSRYSEGQSWSGAQATWSTGW